MERKKVLLTVTTYPLPSRSYDELVCTAGMLEDGTWIRIYPIPLSFLIDLTDKAKIKGRKYTWVELDLRRRIDDFRPESYSPVNYDFRDINVGKKIEPGKDWAERRQYCLTNLYTDLTKLIEDSKAPINKSLATFKPTKILSFSWEEEKEKDWKDAWQALRKQGDLFADPEIIKKAIPKLPYKFFYTFQDDKGKESRLMIEDWEIGQLYWKCLSKADGKETIALQKVKEKYYNEFVQKKDVHLFLGTTKEWHIRRSKNPFVIIGVFYPPKQTQFSLF